MAEPTYLLRDVTSATRDDSALQLSVVARQAVALPGVPGYLTGEPLIQQGIETTLPNLPDLVIPPTETTGWTVRVEVWAPRAVRLIVAPDGARVFREPASWLGMVTGSPRDADVTFGEAGANTFIGTNELRVTVQPHPFAIQVNDITTGRTLLRTAHRLRQVAGFPLAPAVLASHTSSTLHLELGTDEDILGFGEQFGRLVKNGQRLVLRVEDALGTGTGMAYKPVPVWHSTCGYLGFLNTGATVTADVGHTRPSVLGLTVDDEAVDLFVVASPDAKQRLTGYTDLTGRAAVPPLWAFSTLR